MKSDPAETLRATVKRSKDGWWFDGVFSAFDPLLTPYGYELAEAKSTFRGDSISYAGSPYRVVFELDPETKLLRGEFWDEATLDRENHLRVLRFWDLLRSRDPAGSWSEPKWQSISTSEVLHEIRRWADGLARDAADVLAGGVVPRGLWVDIW